MSHRAPVAFVAGTCLLVGAAAGFAAGRWWARGGPASESPASEGGAAEAPEKEAQGAAAIRTVAATEGTIHRTVEALGIAAIPPVANTVVAWPADIVIARLLVQAGETVKEGDPLTQIAATRDVQTQLQLTKQAAASATRALEATQERLDRGLATRSELLAAQAAAEDADHRLERLQSGLPPSDGLLRAPVSGIVGAVRAQAGATITAGTPILELSAPGAVVAVLGVEPSDMHGLTVGQAVRITPVGDEDTARYEGTVSLIAPAINATSRLIDVTVSLSGPALPRPGLPLSGSMSLPAVTAVLIPRRALILENDEAVVYVVRDGKAVRSPVTVLLRSGDQVALASGCKPEERVVVVGQGQLTDGAPVREERGPEDAPQKGAAGEQ